MSEVYQVFFLDWIAVFDQRVAIARESFAASEDIINPRAHLSLMFCLLPSAFEAQPGVLLDSSVS